MTVTIIRHGQTQSNKERRYSGKNIDEHLTEDGIAELETVSARLTDDGSSCERDSSDGVMLFVSPMVRAIETANILFPGMEQNVISELREMDFGLFEGRNHAELDGDADYQAWIDSGGTMQIPEGESMASFTDRTMDGIRKAVKAAAGSSAIYIVAHGGTVMAAMSALTGDDYYSFHSGNGCGYTIELEVDNAGNIIAAGAYDRFCGGIRTGSADR